MQIFDHIKIRYTNIKSVFSKIEFLIIAFVSSTIIGGVMAYFTQFQLVAGNLGYVHAYLEVILQTLIAIFFGLNMALLIYKLKVSAGINASEAESVTFGAILGIIVSGCPACSITLASYLGLASLFSSLPFFGLEVKALGLLLLMYSTDSLAKNLHKCEFGKQDNFLKRIFNRKISK